MALFKGLLVSKVSGSIGGLTFAHNKGGPYIRNRATPTDPNSPQQQAVRGFVGNLAARWNGILTDVQRATWETYAANVTVLDPFGDPRLIPAISHFVRSNVPRMQSGEAPLDVAPTIFNLGEFTNPAFNTIETTEIVEVTFDTGDAWVGEDGSKMLVYASRPQNPGKLFFKGPYRYADSIDGDATTPPTSPASISLPFPCVSGQNMFYRVAVMRADGRYSLSFRDRDLVA